MVRLKGHFDGQQIVLDETVPAGIREGASVDVVFDDAETATSGAARSFVERVWPMMGKLSGPSDLSEEHDHYAHGAPKRKGRNG